jgi:AcrR family transcriptional regulator
MQVIADEGVRAVTHRRVAAQSGASVGLVTYYFSTTDELIKATLTEIVAEEARAFDRMRERVEALDGDLDGIVELFTSEISDRAGARKTATAAGMALTLELTDPESDRQAFDARERAEEALFDAVVLATAGAPDADASWFLASTLQGTSCTRSSHPDLSGSWSPHGAGSPSS